MKNIFKRVVASLLVAVMLFGSAPIESLTGFDFDSLFAVEAEAANGGLQYPIRKQASDGQWYRLYKPQKAHKGVDFSANTDTNIYAVDSGKVVIVYSNCSNYNGAKSGNCNGKGCSCKKTYIKSGLVVTETSGKSNGFCNLGYGNGVVIQHSNGKYSHYAHMSTISVSVGSEVTAKTIIGKVGSSGNSEGPHLHFAYSDSSSWDGQYEDPFNSVFLPWFKIYVTSNNSNAPIITGEFPWTNNSFSSCGIEFGESSSNLNKKASDTNGTSAKHFYNLSKNFGALTIGKKYYFRLWLEKSLDGRKVKYQSPIYSFKVGEGDVTFVDYSSIQNAGTSSGSGNTEQEKTGFTLIKNEYAEYLANKSNFYVKDRPYEIGNNIGSKVEKNSRFVVLASYKNDYGNKWYKVKYSGTEGFVYSGHLTKIKDLDQVEFTPNYPQGKLDGRRHTKGTTFQIKGSIVSHTSKLVAAQVKIMKFNSTFPYLPSVVFASNVKNPQKNTFDISTFDSQMKFKQLDVGNYVFVVESQIEGGEKEIVHYDFFKVVSNSNDTSNVSIIAMANITNTPMRETLKEKENNKDNIVVKPTNPTTNTNPDKVISAPSSSSENTIVFKVGDYRTNDSLNVRTGPGSSYAKATSAIPKGTEIGITEVSSNGWGKTVYNGATGWVSLSNCTYVRAFAAIQKPGKVTVNYNSDKDVATGSIVNVSWNAINYADSYNVYLKNSNGTVVKSQADVRGTSTYFTVDEAGAYYITVAAINSQHIGDESAPSASFTVHAPCTVTFKDWNGRTETRIVRYGEAASAPLPPTREGYTFIGWDKTFDHVTSDITVNAVYEIRSYTVKFVKTDSDGKTIVLKSEKVKYCESATPPEDTQPPEFRAFVGWSNSDYINVKGNVTVLAVYQWIDPQKPVGISNASATRINGGYTIEFDVSSTEAGVTHGRVIVSLKTAAAKQIVTTESAAFSLASNTQNKEMEIFVPSDDPASVAEIYVVESFGVAIPRSDVIKCNVNLNDQWSSWVDAKGGAWPDNTWEQRESRTVYRYQTKSFTTSTSATKSGWTKYDTTYTKSTGSTYNQVSAVNTDAHVRKVSTTKEDVYSTYYRYLHYTNGGYNEKTGKNVTWACSPYKGNTDDGYGPTNIGPHYYESATPLAYQTSTTWNIRKYNAICTHSVTNKRYSCQTCLNTWFYNETAFQKVTGSKTKYHYEDYYYTYYFYKWSDWSAWTTTVHNASDTKTVESKLQYRYKNNSLGVEDNSGVVRVASSVSSGLKDTDILLPNLKEYAGDDVMLYIYKYNEASDWTGEFIGQTAIDANGNYSFNFILREEPTAETGDFMVSIGIEGCTGMINVGKLVAPNPEYKVVFKYSDPSNNANEDIVLDEQVVEEGKPVVAPQHIEFEGYKFLGWNTDLSYVTEETMFVEYGEETEEKIITFKANYEPEEYVVVFIDWDNDSVVMKRYNYGENIVAPIIKTTEGYQALWEGLDMENPVVTGDTVITAKHSKKVYEVNFYNYDGEIIDTQFVEYGSTAADVNVEDKDNYIFIDWEYSDDLFDNAIVEGDTIYAEDPVVNFYPVYIFAEKVAEPVSSLEDGTYADAQTVELTCDTEGAVIYYTLDGADPKTAVNDIDQVEKVFEYTGPITIDRSVTLKYYACAFEKNDSEVVTNYYAVNAGQTESAWMLQDDIPDYVTENTDDYEISSVQGYRYRDAITSSTYSEIANFEAQGWFNEGFEYGDWSDWFMTEPVLNDMAYEAETQQPEPELEVRYQYSRYKYFDTAKNEYVYSPTQVEGYECEYETIQLETKLSTAGYVSGTTTKYYLYNNERWFNYELTEIEVVPDYMMYRYRLKVYTLKKWSAWTTDAPAENETRENESATVYRYTIPEMCVVKIVPDHSAFGVDTLTYIIEVNEYLLIDENDYTFEGYDFIGFFTDPEFTNYFNHKTTPISGAVTLYPKYQAHTFNVMFVDYDGTVLYEESVEYGQSASTSMFEDMEREGYVFIGWDYESLDFITSDVIATAQYVKKEEYCSVSLNYNRYSLMNGNSFQLVAEITPAECENKNLIWYSTDESVVTVSDDGFVTAVGEGEASIIVETEATGFVDECVVVVSTNPATSLCLIPGSKLGLDEENGLLRGVSNTDCTVESIKTEFMNADLVFTDKNGNILEDTALAGTGTVISFSNGGKVVDEVTLVVTGDMTGDGKVNNRDVAMIVRYLVDKETADLSQMVAIDVNADGYVNNRDAAMVSRYLVGKETI